MNALNPTHHTSLLAAEHAQTGYDLGWDHARHAVAPPATCLAEPTALRAGWVAGCAMFGERTLPASRSVHMWLQLRRDAWLTGRPFEAIQLTAHYLAQLEVGHCPIVRTAFTEVSVFNGEAVFGRLRADAGYAAGHLALLSAKAAQAVGRVDWRAALRIAQQLDAGLPSGVAGLTSSQWARLAVLRSFVEPMAHDEACELPLLVLPPNRLRLFNPVQALQAFVCRQLLVSGWSLRISRIEALVPGQAARQAFQTFFHALLPRVLEAGRNASPDDLRWAIEDAWRHPLVGRRWSRFARQLSAAQCEALVLRAHAKRLGQGLAQAWDDALAREGWRLEPQAGLALTTALHRRPRGGMERFPRRPPPVQAALPLH